MATVPVEITWVSGQVVTAAQLNSNVRDALNFLLSPPTCELLQTVAQSCANGSTTLLFDNEYVDTDNMHNTVTNTTRITAQTPGRYQIAGATAFAANATGTRGGWYLINGSAMGASEVIIPASASAGAQTEVNMRTKSIYMNVGDYCEISAWQTSGGPINSYAGGQGAPGFFMRWISTA